MNTAEIVSLPLDRIHPCPYQPRVNVSVPHLRRLERSMASGRHEPLIEVEPSPSHPGDYQIVWGEQRWRAAVGSGRKTATVRVRPNLTHLERLQVQLEENRLRQALDPVEEAHAILLHKTLADIRRAEELLAQAGVTFDPLESRTVEGREDFAAHLDRLRRLMAEHGVRRGGAGEGSPLTPWSETETALGISETTRKARIGILRLPPDLQERVRDLPTEHAAQIGRLSDPVEQREAIERAVGQNHEQVRAFVSGLRDGKKPADSTPERSELRRLTDVCRQLARLLRNADPHLSAEDRGRAGQVLAGLRDTLDAFLADAQEMAC